MLIDYFWFQIVQTQTGPHDNQIFYWWLLSAIAKVAIRCIHKVIHKVGIVTIENLNTRMIMAITAGSFKANCPGDHPFTRRRVPSRQPTSCISTTVIQSNRSINDLCAGLAGDTIPTITFPLWSDIIRPRPPCIITTIVTIAKDSLGEHVVSWVGV